jgi:hypothetical protein
MESKMKNWKTYLNKNTIVITVFILVVLYSWYSASLHREKLKKEGIIGSGKILGDKFIKGSRIKYYFHEKEYLETTHFGSSKIGKIVNRTFPVIYLKDDEKVNHILIFKKDFEDYNLKYPDSLKWVCDSLKLDDCRK